MSNVETYVVNEQVLCYHGPLMYEAKVLKVHTGSEPHPATGQEGPHYYVHYKGWKQTWDEWVPVSRLLKVNEENMKIKNSLHLGTHLNSGASKTAKGADKNAGGSATSYVRGAGRKDGGTRGQKRGRDEDEASKRPELKMTMPELMKAQLVDDWEAVTKNNQLVSVPRQPNVKQILEEFGAYIHKEKPPNLPDPDAHLGSVLSGLRTYFDRALGKNLLYRFERPQYASIREKFEAEQKEMSEAYGAEHFLRMMVSLPQMAASASLDPEAVSVLGKYCDILLEWMVRERSRLFLRMEQYDQASIQYQNLSRS
ncbi:MRG-domain-containing protein [Schizophyllum amplum]|uniref:Chromatin modification-related protein EAF3 n=1 Tax=Schizophyllum amplum TaxID=97359 RepID=A0A550CWQ7_9AGAR|nr:MRG-domain-containing protein [Auriculariopsis ampla]